MNNQTPTNMAEAIFNIGAITRMTGIPAPTLHAWERRYGFPQAARTTGGHRLYSEIDIARLRWVKSQLDSGLTISRAIAAARLLESDGHLFLLFTSETGIQSAQRPAVASLRDLLLDALTHHDLTAADRLMGEMLAFHSPEFLTLNVIGPVLARLGEAWEQGHITVATEHLGSNYLRHRLLMWMVTGPTPRRVNSIVLACTPGEWHEGGLLMLGVLLRRQGWPVSYLGQNMPFADLTDFVRQIQAGAVVLACMREETAPLLANWPKWIEQTAGNPLVAFGGRAFVVQPELQGLVPGSYLGDSVQEGMEKLEELLCKHIS